MPDGLHLFPAVRPYYLTPAELLVEYERLAASGYRCAAARVAMLRKQLAANTEETTP